MCFVTFASTKIGSEHVLLALMEFESINAILPQLSTKNSDNNSNMVVDTTTLMGMAKRLAGADWYKVYSNRMIKDK